MPFSFSILEIPLFGSMAWFSSFIHACGAVVVVLQRTLWNVDLDQGYEQYLERHHVYTVNACDSAVFEVIQWLGALLGLTLIKVN